MPITYRPFMPADAEAVIDLVRRQFAKYNARWAEEGTVEWLRGFYTIEKVRGWTADFVTVAEDGDGRIVAMVRGKADGWLVMLYVEDDFMGRGIGGELLARVERQMIEAGPPVLQLNAFPDNHAYYARRGWEEVERTVEHGMQFVVMRKPAVACDAGR